MGFIIYSATNIQVNLPIKTVLSVIKQEKGHNTEVEIQPEVTFITNEDRKGFYKYYNRQYEDKALSHKHRNITTVHCAPIFRNTLVIHLLIAFSSVPYPKYVGIYSPLIPDWIEFNQAQILFPRQMQNGDTEQNSKYCLKEYLNIA